MRENLRATKFKDGTSLVYQRSATDDQKNQTLYLNEYSTGTQYQKVAMYDYYKKDDSFDVESQSDEVKKRYGLHYNFSAVAGDYDPYVQNLGAGYNILSQDIEGQTNNSLCPMGGIFLQVLRMVYLVIIMQTWNTLIIFSVLTGGI